MSGPDGGEPPLDVDARFADIIAHFHDDEPTRPTVVDSFDGTDTTEGSDGPAGSDRTDRTDATTGPDGTAAPAGPEADPAPGTPDALRPDRSDPRPPRSDAAPAGASGPPETSSDPVRDLSAPTDLAAMRRSYEARIAAEVDRAVDGPDGGHFVPADPPPLPRPDLPGRLAWTAVLVGPAILLLCALLWQSAPSWLLGTVVTAVVAGFGYLVWRLPRTRDRDDPGDGAIV